MDADMEEKARGEEDVEGYDMNGVSLESYSKVHKANSIARFNCRSFEYLDTSKFIF